MLKNVTFIILFVFCFSLWGNTVKNPDKPLKGEWDFNLQKLWEVDSAGDNILARISSIRLDKNGNVYIFERKSSKFFVFDPNGKFLFSFGKRGEGPGEYKMVFNFFLKEKYVIVPDMGKIHFFSKKGEFIRSHNPIKMMFPRGFVDSNRIIMVNEKMGEKSKEPDFIEIYDLNTKKSVKIAEIEPEKALTYSGGGIRLVLKIGDTTPTVITELFGEHLFYGKNDKYMINKVDLKGNKLLSFSIEGRKRKKISEASKRKRFENVILNGRKMPKEMVDKMVQQIPDYSVFFKRILVEKNGLIYILVADLGNNTGQEIDIFSSEGKYLYHSEIKMPDNYIIKSSFSINGNNLYVFVEDEEGEVKLVKFSISKPTL